MPVLNRPAILITFLCGLSVAAFMLMPATGASQQEQDRIIVKKTDFDPPMKITGVKTEVGKVKLGEKFRADDNWFRALAVSVANTSGKRVTYIDVEVTFLRSKEQEREIPLAGAHLEYGHDPFAPRETPPPDVKPVLPGDTVDISLSDLWYVHIKANLAELKHPASPTNIEVRVIHIGYSDGTLWSHGRILRRDPKERHGWSPADEPHSVKQNPKNPLGSARNRTANFFCDGCRWSCTQRSSS